MIGWCNLSSIKELKAEDSDKEKTFSRPDDKYYHHAYPRYKYETSFFPLCLFKPTDEILIKLMRASLYITKESQFVFNSKNI